MQTRVQSRYRAIFAGIVAFAVIMLSACSGPAASTSAALVDSQNITMQDYQNLAKLYYAASLINDPTVQSWQVPSGRSALVTAQKTALRILVDNILLEHDARQYKVDLSAVHSQTETSLQTIFKSIPAQLQPLVDQKVLTMDSFRPLVYQQNLETAVYKVAQIQQAHVKIITVTTQQQAETILQQLQKGGSWNDLAAINSIDPAKPLGGDIATLFPGILPPEVDAKIFVAHPDTNLQIVKSTAGYSVVQVIDIQPVKIGDLSASAGIFPSSTVSIRDSAGQSYLRTLIANGSISVYVNWCDDPAGNSCGTLA